MKKILSVLVLALLTFSFCGSALADIPVSEYLTDGPGITPFDTSKPTKIWSWSDGTYYGSLVNVKSWTNTRYCFYPTSTGKLFVWLKGGTGSKENYKVYIIRASDNKKVATLSQDSDSDGVINKKWTVSGLTAGTKYYVRVQHYSGYKMLSGSGIYVNNSSKYNV